MAHPRVALDYPGDFDSIDFRHFEVEKDKAWAAALPPLKLAAAINVVQSLFAVFYPHDVVGKIVVLKTSHRQLGVQGTVVDKENLDLFVFIHAELPSAD
jgi:hypothetical protein